MTKRSTTTKRQQLFTQVSPSKGHATPQARRGNTDAWDLEEGRGHARKGNLALRSIVDALMDDYSSVVCVDYDTGEVEVYRIEGRVLNGMPVGEIPYALLAYAYVIRAVFADDREEMLSTLAPASLRERLGEGTGFTKAFRDPRGRGMETRVARVGESSALIGFKKDGSELEELARHAYVDSLTQAKNRRYYDETLATMPCQALVIADVDRFKRINDEHGHQCGDDALAAVVEAIGVCLGEKAEVVRYGGDEFVVAFDGIAPAELAEVLKEMRAAVGNVRLERHPDVQLSVSLGAAYTDAPRPAQELFGVADEALYASKVKNNTETIITLHDSSNAPGM